MQIHAFRRKGTVTVELLGEVVEFVPNEAGDVVATVDNDEVAARLLEVSEAYRPYKEGKQAKAPAPAPEPEPETPKAPEPSEEKQPEKPVSLILTNGEETIDLGAMSAKEVRAFAEKAGIKLPGSNGTPVAELRRLTAEALQGGDA